MDPLTEIPPQKWPELQEKMKVMWPSGVAGYYTLQFNINNPILSNKLHFKVYCPYGDLDSGFVAMTEKGEQECIICPTSNDITKLEEALVNTKKLKWDETICVDGIVPEIRMMLERLPSVVNVAGGFMKTYFFDKKTRGFDDLRLHPGTSITAIQQQDIPQVDNAWHFQYPGSEAYFSTLAANGLSYGLYSDSSLVAWVFINEFHCLNNLFCEQRYRRRGYSECLLKWVINDQLKQGNDLYGYVLNENESACKLMSKLGFVVIENSSYMFLKKP